MARRREENNSATAVVEELEGGDDLLHLGVEVVELALIGGDLFVEARFVGGV